MLERPDSRFRPGLERLEAKLALSTASAAPMTHLRTALAALASSPHSHPDSDGHLAPAGGRITARAKKPNFGYLVYRVTNPSEVPFTLTPPFGHVLVQARQPVPGQMYNILQIAVKNTTKQTYDASNGFAVRLPQQRYTPILTGDQQWKPGETIIFYALTKQYYPLLNQVSDGFQFKLGGAWSVAVPGPSAIFLRIKYDPDTINRILDYAATRGPGAQGGTGLATGMADTAIWAFAPSTENRNDFGGYF